MALSHLSLLALFLALLSVGKNSHESVMKLNQSSPLLIDSFMQSEPELQTERVLNKGQNLFQVTHGPEFSRVKNSGIIIKSKTLVGVSIVVDQQTHVVRESDLLPLHHNHNNTGENYQKLYLAMDEGIYGLSVLNGDDWLLKMRIFLDKGQTKEILVRR